MRIMRWSQLPKESTLKYGLIISNLLKELTNLNNYLKINRNNLT